MDILKLARNIAGFSGLHVVNCPIDGDAAGVGFRRRRKQNHRVCQRKPRLRKPQLQRTVNACLDNRNRLRIGKSNVLARGAENPPARAGQISCLQKPRQIVNCRVGVRAADGLHERGQIVVVLISRPVVAHR